MALKLFVAGSHTDVGKTHVAAALLRAARAAGLTVAALKPVVSGFDPDDWEASDPGRLLAAMGTPPTDPALAAIAPLRYAAPLAPPMAARLEGERLTLEQLAGPARAWLASTNADLAVVEGAGGLMSPIAEDATGLELMAALAIPAVLVGGSYLGAMSHSLTALEVMRAHGLQCPALVVSESSEADAPDFAQSVDWITRFAGATPVIAAPRAKNETGHEAWADALLERLSATV